MKRYVTLVSGRESASRTLPRMRIGCGRLIAVLWTLLMKDASRLGKHHKGRLFLRQPSSDFDAEALGAWPLFIDCIGLLFNFVGIPDGKISCLRFVC